MARRPMARALFFQGRDFGAAQRQLADRTAGVEVAARGRADRAGDVARQPDAFALAVYDAVWLAAQAYLATGGTGHVTNLKSALVTAADGFYGASGWTKLNAAGDRKFGDFDFFAVDDDDAHEAVVQG